MFPVFETYQKHFLNDLKYFAISEFSAEPFLNCYSNIECSNIHTAPQHNIMKHSQYSKKVAPPIKLNDICLIVQGTTGKYFMSNLKMLVQIHVLTIHITAFQSLKKGVKWVISGIFGSFWIAPWLNRAQFLCTLLVSKNTSD